MHYHVNRQAENIICNLRPPSPFLTMPADNSNITVSNSNKQKNIETIKEGIKVDVTVKGHEMNDDNPELMQNSKTGKTHIIMHFNCNGQNTNI
jgi:hypothetical protein